SIATSFSFTAAPTTAIYTLSLHDALPILIAGVLPQFHKGAGVLLDVSGHILEVQYARADQDLAGHKAAQFRNDRRAELFCFQFRSEEHTSELQSRFDLVCRLLLEKKKKKT